MPGIDGWETLRRLKSNQELQNTPVVIISIVAERRRALILGAVEAITKPIIQDELLAILQRNLHSASANRILVVDDNPEVQELFANLLPASSSGDSYSRQWAGSSRSPERLPTGFDFP